MGAVGIDDMPVHKAIREALANCSANTDFYLPRDVVVKKEADSIIMGNLEAYVRGKADVKGWHI